MNLSQQEIIRYFANIISIARLDKKLSPKETDAISLIQNRMGAKKADLKKAYSMVESPEFKIEALSRFATNVQLLEDMIAVALADDCNRYMEEPIIYQFSDLIGISKDQLERIICDTKTILATIVVNRYCPSCGREISNQAKFCPECGAPVIEADKAGTINVEYIIPKEGVAIEFTESTASGFPEAVKISQNAHINSTCVRSKKTWYLASWPISEISKAGKLAQCLKGMRNRKVYIDGSETAWDDVFGYSWCAEHRDTAFKPIEYCFGIDEKRFNIWGCKQTRMDWTEWTNWLAYGTFKKKGFLSNQVVFEFDKNRISHELQTNLFRFRYCPYINYKLIAAIVDVLPSEVIPSEKGPWVYKRDYNESLGAIKIKTCEERNGYTYTDEYYSSGVAPKSLALGIDILKEALKKVKYDVTDINCVLEYKG
jgi:uncharacterized tellurite resistance protein B-like protein